MDFTLSVIIPAYNEEKALPATVQRVSAVLRQAAIHFELLLVDDGSRDGTWAVISSLTAEYPTVRGIRFSRNFGKESAMFAGLEQATGECCVILDSDLQHPPEKIVEMVARWQEGYEVIEGVKDDRGQESSLHRAAAGTFYRLIGKAVGVDMADASDFKLLDRKVVDTLNRMPERNVFFRALSYWVGFKKTTVSYTVEQRTAGESKWNTRSLFRYAVRNIASFTGAPLHIVTWLGALMLLVSCVLGVVALVQKITGQALGGFTTVILIQLFTGSILMISLGIIGYYIARIFEEIKGRPRYIITDTCGKCPKKDGNSHA